MSRELWKEGVQWRGIRPDGAIRHSQLVSTYGPGALIDLVDDAAIVAGLSWWSRGEPIIEDRLLGLLSKEADYRNVRLYAPPPTAGRDLEDPNRKWIKVFRFPEWFTCQNEKCWADSDQPPRKDGAKPRRLLRINQLDDHKCKGVRKRSRKFQPVRFTRACRYGHIEDINWFELVHVRRKDPEPCRRMVLWIDEAGASGDLGDVRIACSGCGSSLRMSVATQRFTKEKEPTLGFCQGRRPWIGGEDKREDCREPMRFLLRSASHAFFPVNASVIHIPDHDAEARDRITKVIDLISDVESVEELELFRKRQKPVREGLEGIPSKTAYAEVVRRRDGQPLIQKKPKEAEVEVLLSANEEKNNDRFTIVGVPLPKGRKGAISLVDKLALLPRLTEVRALVGFTRFEPKSTDIDGDLDIGAEVARPDDPLTWLPAVENRGEGFFFSLRDAAVSEWETKLGVRTREDEFKGGFKAWQAQRDDRKKSRDDFATVRYVLLHSLSHLLITAVSLECGYAASSIRERIYAGAGGSGILLYTASPGAEGSLGGLVEVGRRLERYLEHALDLGRLCSNDPVCAAHRPDHEAGGSDRYLEGSSCHGCLLISEPSCERMNTYLDRTLVVPTVESSEAAFFGGF
ncbi:MAG: DUF1998 domain-containing protein [Polyangiaceae bacterium]